VPKPPAALNRATRGVILANEARMMRLNALTKREPTIDGSIAIFHVFPPTRDAAVVLVSEERDRLAAARQQAQMTLGLALAQCIRAIFPDGAVAVYRTDNLRVSTDRNPIGCSIKKWPKELLW
jgi:hypothetical protein